MALKPLKVVKVRQSLAASDTCGLGIVETEPATLLCFAFGLTLALHFPSED